MASSSFPKIRQKAKKTAPLPPHRQNSDKTRKNQGNPRSDFAPGDLRRNEHPFASIPMQQRVLHNFDAPTRNSPLQAKRDPPPSLPLEASSHPPTRPLLSSIFPMKGKTTGTKSPPNATSQQPKMTSPVSPASVGSVGSPTSAKSSSSNERSAERKAKRHSLRKLLSAQQKPPRVKDRSGGGGTRPDHRRNQSDSSSVEAMEEMSYRSFASGSIPYPPPMAAYPPPVALYPTPPVLLYPANYLPPQPEPQMWTDHEDELSSLKDIKENDQDGDDIKGFDDFAMY